MLTRLRPYQREIADAVLRSVMLRQGLTFSVEIARQGGKNEVSAVIELVLLVLLSGSGGTMVKAAPTLRPQARTSLRRLRDRLKDAGLLAYARIHDDSVELGQARVLFLSAAPSANVVGQTADRLLEIDESQDVSPEKYSRDFRPMASTGNATTVHYGTAWSETSLLEQVKRAGLEAARQDGIQRHFRHDWLTVARYNPDYARYVAAEAERLGADHPLFLTQYALQPLPGGGRLFDPAQLARLAGDHALLELPRDGERYVAGVDLAGEDADPASPRAGRDAVVVTLAAISWPEEGAAGDLTADPLGAPAGLPRLRVVRWYQWVGEPHGRLLRTLADLLGRTWRCLRVAVDATGVGEPVASFLAQALGEGRVQRVTFSQRRKSELGHQLLAAVAGGRLVAPAPPLVTGGGSSPELVAFWQQVRLARRHYRPNQTLGFDVDPAQGHDDFVMSLALLVEAAAGPPPRYARGRLPA